MPARGQLLRNLTYLLIFVAGVVADYQSKAWVTTHLANDNHGQLVEASPADAGRRVVDVVAERSGASPQRLLASEAAGRRPLMRLDTQLTVSADERAFLRPGSAYWMVRERTARRLPALGAVADDVAEHLDDTLIDYVRAKRPLLSEEALREALATTYLVDYSRVRCADPVRGDEVWVLLDHTLVPWSPWLNVVYAENPGAAWGLFDDATPGLRRGGLLLSATLAASVIAFLLWRLRGTRAAVSLGLWLVLSGAAGNAWDRWTLGYVVDFVDVAFGGLHWPTFNVADVLISVGAGLLVLDLIRHRRASLLLGGAAAVVAREALLPPEAATAPRALDLDRV